MKTILKTSLILIVLITSGCAATKDRLADKNKTDVNLAFSQVYKATQEAMTAADMNGLELENIDLTFATTVESTVGVGVKLWVLSGSYSRTKSTAKTTTFTFGKTDSNNALTSDKNIKVFKDYLVSVINSAKSVKDIDKFGLTEFSAEVEFTINHTLEGGAEIELLPVTASLNGSKSKEVTHTITLNFKKLKK
jgi:hypothetical protein